MLIGDKLRSMLGSTLDNLDDALYAIDHEPRALGSRRISQAHGYMFVARTMLEKAIAEVGPPPGEDQPDG